MKQIQIIGNIGRNAEAVTTTLGREKMRFSVAVSTNSKKETTWFSVLANMQEKLMPYLVKGRQIYVSGDFAANVYNNAAEITIFANHIELCGGGKETTENDDEETI